MQWHAAGSRGTVAAGISHYWYPATCIFEFASLYLSQIERISGAYTWLMFRLALGDFRAFAENQTLESGGGTLYRLLFSISGVEE